MQNSKFKIQNEIENAKFKIQNEIENAKFKMKMKLKKNLPNCGGEKSWLFLVTPAAQKFYIFSFVLSPA